jgi:hypothetical protein
MLLPSLWERYLEIYLPVWGGDCPVEKNGTGFPSLRSVAMTHISDLSLRAELAERSNLHAAIGRIVYLQRFILMRVLPRLQGFLL